MSSADDAVSFEEDIKPLFRPTDHEAMAWAFDLSSYDEVKENARRSSSACATVRCPVTASGRKTRWNAFSDGPRRACASSAYSVRQRPVRNPFNSAFRTTLWPGSLVPSNKPRHFAPKTLAISPRAEPPAYSLLRMSASAGLVALGSRTISFERLAWQLAGLR